MNQTVDSTIKKVRALSDQKLKPLSLTPRFEIQSIRLKRKYQRIS